MSPLCRYATPFNGLLESDALRFTFPSSDCWHSSFCTTPFDASRNTETTTWLFGFSATKYRRPSGLISSTRTANPGPSISSVHGNEGCHTFNLEDVATSCAEAAPEKKVNTNIRNCRRRIMEPPSVGTLLQTVRQLARPCCYIRVVLANRLTVLYALVTTTFPNCFPSSKYRCAAAVSANGHVLSTTGCSRPCATSFNTVRS